MFNFFFKCYAYTESHVMYDKLL